MIADTGEVWTFAFYTAGVLAVVATMLGLPALLGERHSMKRARRTEVATALPYESGVVPTGSAQLRLPVQYYLVAMFFVIFDLEAVFLYAWAVGVRDTGWMGLTEAALFIAILLAALVYLWRSGALDWSAQYQRPSVHRLTRHPRQTKDEGNALVA